MQKFDLPVNLYDAKQSKIIDKKIIEQLNVTGIELMHRAAEAVFNAILHEYPKIKSLIICCGSGNNAGDGYLVATLAKQRGFLVKILTLTDENQLKGDALEAFLSCNKNNIPIEAYTNQELIADVIVDALLGTGISATLRKPYFKLIEAINRVKSAVCSIDIPSGLSSDTGMPLPIAVEASLTVCVLSLKQGLLTGMAKDYTGKLVFNDLRVSFAINELALVKRLSATRFSNTLLVRDHYSHKGSYGHLLIVGGNKNMGGAAIMAAETALYCGAGLITVAIYQDHIVALVARCPEVLTSSIINDEIIPATISDKKAVVVGPGLGRDSGARKILLQIISASKCTMVLDADALFLLKQNASLLTKFKYPIVLTPHPKEMAYLLDTTVEKIQQDRFQAIKLFHQKIVASAINSQSIIIVLKGSGTLIYDGHEIMLCSNGNPGMAVGGMGDILSGVIGSLLSVGLSAKTATELAVFVHSQAADIFVQQGGYIGMRATEIIPLIRKQLNQFTHKHI